MGTAQSKIATLEKTISALQRQFGQHIIQTAQHLDHRAELLPTGLRPLDAVLGGGILLGQMTEIRAIPGCGATSLALHVIASAQKGGKVGIFVDLADAFDASLAHHIHVLFDPSNFLLIYPPSPADAFIFIQAAIHANIPGVVVLRSHPQQPLPILPWKRLHGPLSKVPLAVLVLQSTKAPAIEAATTRLTLHQSAAAQENATHVRIDRHPVGKHGQSVVVVLLPHASYRERF